MKERKKERGREDEGRVSQKSLPGLCLALLHSPQSSHLALSHSSGKGKFR